MSRCATALYIILSYPIISYLIISLFSLIASPTTRKKMGNIHTASCRSGHSTGSENSLQRKCVLRYARKIFLSDVKNHPIAMLIEPGLMTTNMVGAEGLPAYLFTYYLLTYLLTFAYNFPTLIRYAFSYTTFYLSHAPLSINPPIHLSTYRSIDHHTLPPISDT